RRTAEAVAVPRRGVAGAADSIDRNECAASTAGADITGIRGTVESATGGIAADQRGTGREGAPVVRSKQGSRAEECRDRKGSSFTGRKSGSVGLDFEVQIGISRQHVARAEDSLEQSADLVASVVGKRRAKSQPEAGG